MKNKPKLPCIIPSNLSNTSFGSTVTWNGVQYPELAVARGRNAALPSSMAPSKKVQGNISGEFFHSIADILIEGQTFKTVLSNGYHVIFVFPQPELINMKPANQHER